ncbi:RagB/SusD family nutrient uptake outer membrane protein [Agriterribacter sp.]|uniref:RagB/SusD family nutrient uptake outer membrane protein n=1 Tax=Agriterribacter sp. TaxID=2821509 RepID=UPI002B9CD8BA|nr:RagB/SusD family nutrient uptake outer membrane protein [Agriterribacter sp.]HTN08203.1 RagB/SusD family nutrient uptake outer membrane protein [Agriterribacter sp.]
MNKIYKGVLILVITASCAILHGCKKNYLDKAPTNILTEDVLFSDRAAFNTHMAYLYAQLPFSNFFVDMGTYLSYKTDELVNCTQDQNPSVDPNNDWWVQGYKLIRDLNTLIEKLPTSTVFPGQQEMTQVLGEIKFMRAISYYNLAARYGGVPIITKVAQLPKSGNVSELYAPRDSESDVFKFIEAEMTEAIGMMSTASSFTEYRFNKWSGLAFKSRTMLYAASVAKYGEMQLNGTVGIPKSEAEHFWTSARDAAKEVIESGTYAAYNENSDKVLNYHNLFFDKSGTNRERVFVISYVWPLKGHNFDRNAAPFSHRGGVGYGGRFCPIFDMVESYEYVNDRNGALKLNNGGTPIEYADPADLFKDKDPRMFASVLFPGSPWKGTTLKIYAKIIEGGVEKDGHGADGITQPEATSTGFYLSKWQDPAPPRPIDNNSSDADRICIRYAEVMLNYAEAELELNNEPEARKYVNMIRRRAGIEELSSAISMDDYRQERKIELAFEENRYWDLKRWRVYDKVLNNKDTYALWPVYNKDKEVYTFEKHMLPPGKFTRNFTANLYYNRVPDAVIQTNPLVVQNPGY